ncbi:flavodoxin [Desulfosarcina ovata subsp. sediminis]|uniref:Flavodoxin n=1 Tax=Desulfosarcina ovata subsp. sediminis TaxID=885957 RepID=A0A5K7ZV59_9BACT|nr:flavodoxin [Desulfosarcina ovata]BBO84064.1 flavodoxin [Desulfosarcina ovata subsp. sediminis]
MKKALIIYGSTTGNTEDMAGMVKAEFEQADFEVEVKEVTQAAVADLTADHDLILLGCPAYGDDEIELQEDFAEFYEKLNGIQLNGKPFAVFAPGDSTYEHFCGSVDMLEDKMNDLGGKMVNDGLKIDGDPTDAEGEIETWVESTAASVG